MATVHGAKALGLESMVGQIKEGLEADLCGVRLTGYQQENIYNQILDANSENIFTMIAGNVCYNAAL